MAKKKSSSSSSPLTMRLIAVDGSQHIDQVADLTKHARYGLRSPEGLKMKSQFGSFKFSEEEDWAHKCHLLCSISYEIALVVAGWKSRPNGPAASMEFFKSYLCYSQSALLDLLLALGHLALCVSFSVIYAETCVAHLD